MNPRIGSLSLLLVLASAGNARPQDGPPTETVPIAIENQTTAPLLVVRASRASADTWGPDLLDGRPLPAGDTRALDLPAGMIDVLVETPTERVIFGGVLVEAGRSGALVVRPQSTIDLVLRGPSGTEQPARASRRVRPAEEAERPAPAPAGEREPVAEGAIQAALRWLARHQSPDGRWDSDGFFSNCGRDPCLGPSNAPAEGGHGSRGPGRGFANFDVGLTGLALLAFLGHGDTHQAGDADFQPVVRGALRFLSGIQRRDGGIGFAPDDPSTPENEGETIYGHAIATAALCEAYAMRADPGLRPAAEAAVRFCLQAQNPGYGWRYGISPGDNDTSVTGWMVCALKAARTARLDVPQAAFDGARAWFDRCTVGFDASTGWFDGRTGRTGEVGYMAPGDGGSYLPPQEGRYAPLPTMTAVALVGRIYAGQPREADVIQRGARILMGNLPRWGTQGSESLINFYYWYCGTSAMFQVGGEDWPRWREAIREVLLRTQRMGGCEDGSWDPIDDWGIAGGRVYATAIGALTIEFER